MSPLFLVSLWLVALLGLSTGEETTTEKKPAECGRSNLNSEDLEKSEAKNVAPGNFPWHAGIYHKDKDNWDLKCGGTLISSRHVLTAAHCVTSLCLGCRPPPLAVDNVMVCLGNTHRDWNTTEGVKRKIKTIIVHKSYLGSSLSLYNDIAVLELESGVVSNAHVMPACLDSGLKHAEELTNKEEHHGYVPWWGSTEDCSDPGSVCSTPSDELRFSPITIMGFDECLNFTQTSKHSTIARVTPDKYCTKNVAALQPGSGGGGLTFVFDGLHYVYGLVSHRLIIEVKEKPNNKIGALTSVPYHTDWLKSKVI